MLRPGVLPGRAAPAVAGDHVQARRSGRSPPRRIQAVRAQEHPRQPICRLPARTRPPPAARQHQHQQPGDHEGDDGVPGGETQPVMRHPAQDRIGNLRPGPLPLHQLLGDPLRTTRGTTSTSAAARRQRPPRPARTRQRQGTASTPRYWAAGVGQYSQPGSPLTRNTARSAGPTRPSDATTAAQRTPPGWPPARSGPAGCASPHPARLPSPRSYPRGQTCAGPETFITPHHVRIPGQQARRTTAIGPGAARVPEPAHRSRQLAGSYGERP